MFSLVAAQKFLYLIYINTESFASVAATSAINFFFWAWPNRISVCHIGPRDVCLEAKLVTLQARVFMQDIFLSEHAAAGAGNVPLICIDKENVKPSLPQSYHMT